jgi:hypothetical protein
MGNAIFDLRSVQIFELQPLTLCLISGPIVGESKGKVQFYFPMKVRGKDGSVA